MNLDEVDKYEWIFGLCSRAEYPGWSQQGLIVPTKRLPFASENQLRALVDPWQLARLPRDTPEEPDTG
jgi:hypothetical protein